MPDNVTLNAGSGGATMRTISDASSDEWIPSVICYATSTTPGAGTFQFVGAGAGLPVAQQGTWNVGTVATITNPVAVTGTFWQTTQPVSGTFWQTTQPISAASLPLPSGAATSAKQPALGTAGSASSDVITVQGVASMTALAVSGTVTANAGTNLNTSLLALETGGNLATIAGRTPALGQALAAASVPIVLTAAQLTTLSPLATVAATQSGTWTNTVTQATAASLNATVVGTGTFAVQSAQSGTWNVGTVTTVTTVSAVTAITNALPAGTNLIGQLAEAPSIAAAMNGATPVTVQYGTFTTSSSGPAVLVAGVSGKKVYLLRWSVSANGATNVNLQSHTTTSNATGLRYLTQFATGGGAYCPLGIMATTTGEGLDVNNSNAVAISGEYTYVQF